jgi:malonyl-CoA O-methyltransferase
VDRGRTLYDTGMDQGDIERRFDASALRYENHDALEREVGERLLERTAFTRRPVGKVVDLGCGTGRCTLELQSRFGDASVCGTDLSRGMLRVLMESANAASQLACVQADLVSLPFKTGTIDLVFSNLAIQWAPDFSSAMAECLRVLQPQGMLLFSVPGPGSLGELRAAPGSAVEMPIYMPDLQDVGDLLLSSGFSEPVVDSEVIRLRYPSEEALRRELEVTGGAGFVDLVAHEAKRSLAEVSFEVVYGAAFSPQGRRISGQEA